MMYNLARSMLISCYRHATLLAPFVHEKAPYVHKCFFIPRIDHTLRSASYPMCPAGERNVQTR